MRSKNPAAMRRALEGARDASRKKYGQTAVSLGDETFIQDVVPSPSLMLDYKMGIGGFPYRHAVEVFGDNGLGKTAAIGYGTLANVQRQDRIAALIAVEPTFDMAWAERHGINPEYLLVQRPDNAEEAFAMLHDLVYDNLVDYILFDSIGALASSSEQEDGGKKKAYGASGVITAGLNATMPRLWKNGIGLMLINQQRQAGNFNGNTLYDSPGGEALKHHMSIRIHLKPGKGRWTTKIEGEDILIGRELVCTFKKNKLAYNSKKANFNFFHIATSEYGFGVDTAQDIINVGKVTGVIKGSAWLEHHTFPRGRLHGKPKVGAFLAENPEALETIRSEVMGVMLKEQLEEGEKAAKLKNGSAEPPATLDTEPDPSNPDGLTLPHLLQGDS